MVNSSIYKNRDAFKIMKMFLCLGARHQAYVTDMSFVCSIQVTSTGESNPGTGEFSLPPVLAVY